MSTPDSPAFEGGESGTAQPYGNGGQHSYGAHSGNGRHQRSGGDGGQQSGERIASGMGSLAWGRATGRYDKD